MRRTKLDPSSSPLAAFGVQLRRSREAKKLTQVELGELIGYSDSFLSCVERATRNPTLDFAVRSDERLDTGGTLELMWWAINHTALLQGFPEFAALERKAVEIRLFELGIVPGLLQTPEYARALVTAAVQRGSITREQAEQRLEFHAARQQLLERSPLLHAVLDESCIRRPVGGAEVMARQLDHLEFLASKPSVTLQIAPYSLGEHAPFAVAVTLLTSSDRTVVAYSEAQARGFLERELTKVRAWERDYHQLQVEALSKTASVELIRKARKELHP
ncbi:Scr1 family TA system antitoxin-like transcriptional regulator [Kitasatospora sp. NPDC058965]|uniref:helix-turn-helix domain-containing protein n=1 Tax=Kitasatospora sp. NPDC058965 TaxID=3346682 RepID=UPI0036B472A7